MEKLMECGDLLIKYNIINSLGLLLDAIGVILLYYNGNPLVEALQIINGVDGAGEKITKKANRSRFALILLFIGFLLQIISNFIIKA